METYTVILSPAPDGGCIVVCPAMPGLITEGDTREEALASMAEVMAVWLEIAREDGYEPLNETAELIASRIGEVLEDREAEGWDRTIETAALAPAIPAAA